MNFKKSLIFIAFKFIKSNIRNTKNKKLLQKEPAVSTIGLGCMSLSAAYGKPVSAKRQKLLSRKLCSWGLIFFKCSEGVVFLALT